MSKDNGWGSGLARRLVPLVIAAEKCFGKYTGALNDHFNEGIPYPKAEWHELRAAFDRLHNEVGVDEGRLPELAEFIREAIEYRERLDALG